MKKLIAFVAALVLVLPAALSGAALASAMPASAPIAKGTINKVTYLYWGKSEVYPTLALVGPGEKFDVYEYDKNWVMVLYDTTVSQNGVVKDQSFYCYVKRADITCDPKLTGDSSPAADTGPGKRPGKKPAPSASPGATAEATAETSPETTAEATEEPASTVEQQDEYDWIIRTPGLCNVTVHVQDMDFTCSFALMAQKIGGTAPSSDPAYNHNMHSPYAAIACFGMVASTQNLVSNIGMSQYWSGSGGIEVVGQANAASFYIDTTSDDFALVNFTINLDATATLDPKITDGKITVDAGTTTVNQTFPLPVQLKKMGAGYKFVLPGMKPGGGDLEFPAVLEKTFSDPDYWNKQAQDADKRRQAADNLLQQLIADLRKQMTDDLGKQQDTGNNGQSSTDPLPGETAGGGLVSLAPLTSQEPPVSLAPLVTPEAEPTLAPLVTPEETVELAPLVPSPGDGVSGFPSQNP